MTDRERMMMEMVGLHEEDFLPNESSEKRIAELETIIEEQNIALMELAELITEVME